ncbi:MAG TPA: hypothetical protein VGM98_16800, partial [Schlesneria sp.]
MAQVTLVQCDCCNARVKDGYPRDWQKCTVQFNREEQPFLELDLCPKCQVNLKAALDQMAGTDRETVVGKVALESIAKVEER